MNQQPPDRDLDLGKRIQVLRTELGLTHEDLAVRAGVGPHVIANIEDGHLAGTWRQFVRLCGAFGLTLPELFVEPTGGTSPVSHRAEQQIWRDPETGAISRMISPLGASSPTSVAEVEFPPKAEFVYEAQALVGVDRHLVVLDGSLAMSLGDEAYLLAAGECLYAAASQTIVLQNPFDRPGRYLEVTTRT